MIEDPADVCRLWLSTILNQRVTDFSLESLALFRPICILTQHMDNRFTIRHTHIDGLIGRLALILRR
jgi:hypothetical protein